MLQNKVLEYKLYLAGLAFAAISAIGIALLAFTPFKIIQDIIPACTFKKVTGLYCPGCGGTRAVEAFVTGHFIKSFIYHPFVPYCGILYIIFMARGTIAFLTKGKYQYMKFRDGYIFIGIAILLLQFIIKDVMLLGFGKDIINGL